MNPKTITVEYIAMKPTTTGKERWNVKDSEGIWYSIWDSHVAAQITAGATVNVGVETKGDFRNIKSVVPNAFMEESSFMDTSETKAAFAPTPTPPAKPVTNELSLIIEERIAAYAVAASLVAAAQLSLVELEAGADRALKYYRQTASLSKPIEQKSSSTPPEDFLA